MTDDIKNAGNASAEEEREIRSCPDGNEEALQDEALQKEESKEGGSSAGEGDATDTPQAPDGADGDTTAQENAQNELSDNSDGKRKKPRKKLTPEQKKRRAKKALIIVASVVLVIAVFLSGIAIGNAVGTKALIKQGDNMAKVQYTLHEQLQPHFDEEWAYFVLPDDRTEFKVLQFTDVHIGAGSFSQQKDAWAMNAVATMIREEQPDLVVVTGDIAYPVPFQAGTFNNLNATKIFANMMEKLGVYWTFAYGNHDTEVYSMYSRKDINDYYKNAGFKYCLYEEGASDTTDNLDKIKLGFGNHIINVKNSEGKYIQSLVMMDSHSYIDGDYFGVAWKYDNIRPAQVEWYKAEMDKLKSENKKNGFEDEYVKNLAFFHIPLVEYRRVWKAFIDNNDGKDTKDPFDKGLTVTVDGYEEKYDDGTTYTSEPAEATYYYGVRGESQSKKNGVANYGVFCGYNQDSFFEEGLTHGLKGTFCGHDHYNNFSVEYKGIRLTYGMSIDYLAYPGIYKEHSQRGCTVISVSSDGAFDCVGRNYYDYSGVKHEKG